MKETQAGRSQQKLSRKRTTLVVRLDGSPLRAPAPRPSRAGSARGKQLIKPVEPEDAVARRTAELSRRIALLEEQLAQRTSAEWVGRQREQQLIDFTEKASVGMHWV